MHGPPKSLFRPANWKYVFSRANILAKTIESLWKVGARLSQLHAPPVWVLNGTTGETGVRFEIKGTMLGDYETGYARVPQMKLAIAMAISAAFPVGIGPVTLSMSGLKWARGRDPAPDKLWPLPGRILHVYDGGLYDNLGIESLFDVGRQALKSEAEETVDKIIVSDASPELRRGDIPSFLSPMRLKRLMDITLSQVKKLRVRSFVNFMENNPECGEYVQMGQYAVSAIQRLGSSKSNATKALLKMRWIPADEVDRAANYPTTLRKMNPVDFDLLSRHGYETAKWNAILWGGNAKTK